MSSYANSPVKFLNPDGILVNAGVAMSQLRILQQYMQLTNLTTYSRTVEINGVVYYCSVNNGFNLIRVSATKAFNTVGRVKQSQQLVTVPKSKLKKIPNVQWDWPGYTAGWSGLTVPVGRLYEPTYSCADTEGDFLLNPVPGSRLSVVGTVYAQLIFTPKDKENWETVVLTQRIYVVSVGAGDTPVDPEYSGFVIGSNLLSSFVLKRIGGFVAGGEGLQPVLATNKPTVPSSTINVGFATSHFGFNAYFDSSLVTLPRGGTATYFLKGVDAALTYIGGTSGYTLPTRGLARFDTTTYNWYGTALVRYTVKESFGGVIAESDEGVIRMVINAPLPLSYSVSGGTQIFVSNGMYFSPTHLYSASMMGNFGGVGIQADGGSTTYTANTWIDMPGSAVFILIGGGSYSTTGFIRIKDAAGTWIDVPMGSFGISSDPPQYLSITFNVSDTTLEVGQIATLTPFPDSNGGSWAFSSGNPAVAELTSPTQLTGRSVGSAAVYFTQQGAGDYLTTSSQQSVSVTNNPWVLQWADFTVFVPQSKSCVTYYNGVNASGGYTVTFYQIHWVVSYDGQHAMWVGQETAYECYVTGGDNPYDQAYATYPDSSNPFPTGVVLGNSNVITAYELQQFGWSTEMVYDAPAIWFIFYLYSR